MDWGFGRGQGVPLRGWHGSGEVAAGAVGVNWGGAVGAPGERSDISAKEESGTLPGVDTPGVGQCSAV